MAKLLRTQLFPSIAGIKDPATKKWAEQLTSFLDDTFSKTYDSIAGWQTPLAEAVAFAGSSPVTINIENIEQVTANLTIPSNIELNFRGRGCLNVAAGVMATINSAPKAGLGQIFSGAGIIRGTFNQVAEVLAEWWGAKISPTEFDSAPAIQRAIDFCEARQFGTIVFQDGPYYWCNSGLTIQADRVGLRGGSKRISILHKNFEDGSLLTIGQAGDLTEHNFVEKLRFDVAAGVTTKGTGISLNAIWFHMTDVMCSGFTNGLRINQDSSTCVYTRCDFGSSVGSGVLAEYAGDGSTFWIWEQRFVDCTSNSNGLYGYDLNNCTDLYMERCIGNNNTAFGLIINGSHTGSVETQDLNIQNCEFDSNGDDGIYVTKSEFFDIRGNWGSSRGEGSDGLQIVDSHQGIIGNNRFVNNGRHGIVIATSTYIVVNDNYCVDNAATAVANCAGITISASDHVTLTGNECSKKGEYGVQGQEYGIWIDGACTYMTVTGNDAHGNDTKNFYNNATAVATHRVADNNFGDSNSIASSGNVLTLTDGGKFFIVTSTEDITSIPASYNDRIVTLKFSGTAATNGVVDGGNLKLTANFVFTPDDTLTLVCDGTNWYEKSRAVN